jgi:hypothetical protein
LLQGLQKKNKLGGWSSHSRLSTGPVTGYSNTWLAWTG